MKIVLTCGHPTSGYQMVHRVLLDCGLSQATPSRREQCSPEELQRKLCLSHDVPTSGIGEIVQVNPGKVWQNLAVDLFIANLEQENWGWADVNTVHLLSFWHEFDPQIRFVLAYSSPATTFGKLGSVEKNRVKDAVKDALRSWLFFNDQLLRFYTRHRDRCLLINADAVARVEGQEKLLPLLREQRGLSLSTQVVRTTPSERAESPILGLIASQMLEEMPEVQSLYDELEGSADIFSGENHPRSVLAEMAVAEYQRLEQSLRAGQAALEELASEKDKAQLESAEKWSALAKEISVLEGAAAQHRKDAEGARRNEERLAEEARKNGERLRESEQECNTLLLQLHQVQEELESHLFKARELDREKEKAKQQSAEKLSALEKLLSASKNELEQYKRETTQKNRELESSLLKAKEVASEKSKAQLETVKKLSVLENQISVLESAAAQHREDAEGARRNEERLRECEQESSLLLLQLHHVQEELESYFLKAKDLEGEKKEAERLSVDRLSALEKLLSASENELEQYKREVAQRNRELEKSFLNAKELAAEKEKAQRFSAEKLSALEQELAARASEVARRVGTSQELERENDLLRRQLHQVQEELENYFAKYQELTSNRLALARSADPKRFLPISIDLRGDIQADNWYAAETDGRWAGPEVVSTIVMPPLDTGEYQIDLDIGDAASPSILQNTAISFNGKKLFFVQKDESAGLATTFGGVSGKKNRYPVKWQTAFCVGVADAGQPGRLAFEFPSVLSPAARGSSDARKLAIFLKTVLISSLPGKAIVGLDLRDAVEGSNWYEPEADGRWAGPGPVSVLCLPPVRPGGYLLGLEVVDAIAPEILRDLRCEFAGAAVNLQEESPRSGLARMFGKKRRFPVTLIAAVQISPEQCARDLRLELTFARLISPASKGSADQRKLALRLKHVTLRPLATT